MIGMEGAGLFLGDAGVDYGARLWSAFRVAMSGELLSPAWRSPAMFKLPAYDPLVIAWLGIGVLAVTALALMP
jgi:hypothetical protein